MHPCAPGLPLHVCPAGFLRQLRQQHQSRVGQEVRGCSTSPFEMKHCQCKLGQDRCRKDRSGSRGRLRGRKARHQRCVAGLRRLSAGSCCLDVQNHPLRILPGASWSNGSFCPQAASQPSSGLAVAGVCFCGLSQKRKRKKEYVRMDAAHDILERQLKTRCGTNGIFSCRWPNGPLANG